MGGTAYGFQELHRPLVVKTPGSRQEQAGGAVMAAGWILVNTVQSVYVGEGFPVQWGLNASV